MDEKKINDWIQAAVILGHSPDEHVLCPECQAHSLEVFDIADKKDPTFVIERYLHCPACLAYNVMRVCQNRPLDQIRLFKEEKKIPPDEKNENRLSQQWLEAFCVLVEDPQVPVVCPSCERAYLSVEETCH